MIRPIMQDPIFLAQKSRPATAEDLPVIQDLKDTLFAHREGCVGMAANMIGKQIRIIIVDDRGTPLILVNPRIMAKSGEYEAEEGCLSLAGKRKAIRYEKIKVAYENEKLQPKSRTFTGWTAQIIQHEMDHCEGILI
ncbi:MAG: peptide deformylase [Clostridia bacterium]|nr:peptide deformylase [Clostridiales bacterium]MBQ2976449.1 peptide deformylase [Clostridia bacterium]MBQ6803781.1 peptide deformylase [Clostridia bacterium]